MVHFIKLVEHGRVPLVSINPAPLPGPTQALRVFVLGVRNRCQTTTFLVQCNKQNPLVFLGPVPTGFILLIY
ncbi:hypothetical protein SAMCFNEI73_Ch0025 [Sinorhizobium americanum]|uniref:Uncharacterized protein n=1 Tax=Sinorhizobium americanum TaxID=194963 RepID=A0A1L3LH08_9HYPH|nr:hypothetical protein SAMCCGM7_Ch0026 [Sinorhizobium americanum CCGM7]APG89367.1 hypothetical protein SAMCFNEI73_Ch0025 [Sinorhizobium americanum]